MKIISNIINSIQQKVFNVIKDDHLTTHGEGVVVGVSGGPDSVCLLHILHSLSIILDIKLYPIHINHMLRGEDALRDEEFTASFCKELGLSLSIVRVDVGKMAKKYGLTLEEAGREARYREFNSHLKSTGAVRIAVAHNRNDQAETVMLNIIRGTGLTGLIGMEYMRGAIIRPLLGIDRAEIEEYCKSAALLPRIDGSNLEGEFARNRVRLELFPYVNKSFGADVTGSLCRLSDIAAQDDSFIMRCAIDAYREGLENKTTTQVSLKLEQLKKLHSAVLMRVLKLAFFDILGDAKGIGRVHYNAIFNLIFSGKTGSVVELPRGIRAILSYGLLDISVLKTQAKAKTFEKALIIPGRTLLVEKNAEITIFIEKDVKIDNYEKLGYNSLIQIFDYDSLKRGINIRNRREGDIFKPLKSNGTKKLKKYFIDNKIPSNSRDEIPLISIGNEIVWVIGYKISDKFKITEDTKNILRIVYNWREPL